MVVLNQIGRNHLVGSKNTINERVELTIIKTIFYFGACATNDRWVHAININAQMHLVDVLGFKSFYNLTHNDSHALFSNHIRRINVQIVFFSKLHFSGVEITCANPKEILSWNMLCSNLRQG